MILTLEEFMKQMENQYRRTRIRFLYGQEGKRTTQL